MALELAMRLTADTAAATAGLKSAAAAVDDVGAQAAATAARSDALSASIDGAAAAMRAATEAMQSAADAARRQADMTAAARAAAEEATRTERERTAALAAASAAAERQRAVQQQLSRDRAEAARAAADEALRLAAVSAAMGEHARSVEALRARYVPMAAEAQRYRAALADIRQGEREGALSSAEAAAAIARTKSAFADQVRAARGVKPALEEVAKSGKLAGWQMQQLSYQLNDVVVSLVSGMNPLTVLVQQGSQITPLFGGISGTFRALLAVLTPLNVGLALVAGAVVLGTKAWLDYDKSQSAAYAAVSGRGRALGLTVDDINAVARASADAAGVSVAAARAMATGFAATGKIGKESYAGLIGMARDFGVTIGATTADAGAKLAELFSDPAKGAQALAEQYGLLDGATARYVARLAAQGEGERARQVLLAALPARLADASKATNDLANIWDRTARAAADFYDWSGRALDRLVSGPSPAERLKELRAEVERLRDLEANGGNLSGLFGQQRRQAEGKLAAAEAAEKARQDEAALNRALAAADAASSRAAALAASSPATEDMRQRQALADQQRQLRAGLASGLIGNERTQAAAALEATTRAIESYLPPAEKAAQLQQLDLQIMQARDPYTKGELAAQRARVALSGEVVSKAQVETAAEQARTQVLGEAMAASNGQVAAMRVEIAARRAANEAVAAGTMTAAEAERQMRVELELRPLIVAAARAEGAEKAELTAIIQGLRDAYADQADAERRAAGNAAVQAADQRIARLRLETSLVGANAAARARALAVYDAEAEARDKSLPADLADKRRAQAAAEADMTTALERQRDAYSTLADFGSSALDQITSAITENGLSWKSLGDVARAVVGDLVKTFAELAVLNPLKNALFGANLGTAGDIGGGGSAGGLVGAFLGAVTGAANDNGRAANDNVAGATAQAAKAATTQAATAAVKATTATGLDSSFAVALDAMRTDAASQGFDIGITSGFRSVAKQQELWDAALTKYGSAEAARKWVAPPGSSNHNRGLAADLSYGSDAARTWAHDNAGAYGLNFPLSNEAWHVEPTSARTGGAASSAAEAIDRMAASAGNAAEATSSLSSGLAETASKVAGSAGTVADAGKGFADAATSATTQSQGAFEALLGGLGQMIDGFLSAISNALDSIFEALSNAAGGGSSGGGFLGGAFDFLTKIFSPNSPTVPGIGGGPLDRPPGLWTGGYTGPGGKYEPAGVVHRGEVVWSQEDVARHGGVATVEAMRLGKAGYAAGGPVSMPASLFGGGVARNAMAAHESGGTTFAPSWTITIGDNAGVSREEVEDIVRRESERTYARSVRDGVTAAHQTRQASRGRYG